MKVFISSVIKGMESERKQLSKVVKGFGFECFASEIEGSSWSSAAEVCLNQVRECDIFIGLYGARYGFVPDMHDPADLFDGNRSITEIEFEISRRLNKPILTYVRKEDAYEPLQQNFIKEMGDFYSGLFHVKYEPDADLAGIFKKNIAEIVTQLVRGNYQSPPKNVPEVFVFKRTEAMYEAAADRIIAAVTDHPWPCISVSAGRTTGGVYNSFSNNSSLKSCLNLQHTTFVLQTEYIGYMPGNTNSCQAHITSSLLSKLPTYKKRENLKQYVFLPGCIESGSFESVCTEIDSFLSANIIHLSILGVSPLGEILCIDPQIGKESSFLDQTTSLSPISPASLKYLNPKPAIPYIITIGVGNLVKRSEKIVLVAAGKNKAEVIKKLCFGPISSEVPVTFLRLNRRLEVLIDQEAGGLLSKETKNTNIHWIG